MRTTVTIDDDLLAQVRRYADDSSGTGALLNTVLRAYVQREAASRLALLAGSMPDLVVPERGRPVE